MKNKSFKSITVLILVLALLVPAIVPGEGALAAETLPENMGTIPFNTPFVINTALGAPHEGENWYMYYSFTTGPKKAYYTATIAEDTTLPNWHFSTTADTNYRNWIGYSYLSCLSSLTDMLPNTTYYLLIEKTRYPNVPEVTVTLQESVDDYGDTVDTGTTIYADREYKGCAEDHADQDVFIFNTGNTTYTLDFESSTNSSEIKFYKDKELKYSVWSPLLTGDHDASKVLEKNTTYYIEVRPERWDKVDYSIKMKSADPAQAVKEPGATEAPAATASPTGTVAPGGTDAPGATTAPGVDTTAPSATATPGITTAPGTATATPSGTVAPGVTTAPSGTATPGGTVAPASTPGSDGYSAGRADESTFNEGTITSKDDVKVYYFDTGAYVYEIEAQGGVSGTQFSIYSDIDLTKLIRSFTVGTDGTIVDLSSDLETETRYYVVVRAPVNYTGEQPVTYSFYMDPHSPAPAKPKTMNYRSYIKKNKYVTNRISNVSAVIKGGRVKLRRYSGGFIFKLWKLGQAFRKGKTIKKKKCSFKLAKNCRIVWDEDADGKKGTIQTKAWFNKNFKKNGTLYSQREFGLCVNKKGRVVLIYTGDMFGAEQT